MYIVYSIPIPTDSRSVNGISNYMTVTKGMPGIKKVFLPRDMKANFMDTPRPYFRIGDGRGYPFILGLIFTHQFFTLFDQQVNVLTSHLVITVFVHPFNLSGLFEVLPGR